MNLSNPIFLIVLGLLVLVVLDAVWTGVRGGKLTLSAIQPKFDAVVRYVVARAGESSTWQGIGFLLSLFTARFSGVDWGQAAAFGGIVSGMIKALFPDVWRKQL